MDEIIVASDRSETLTRQLLVFSSKQDAMHEVLDLGETCESVRTMVRPILGASNKNISVLQKPLQPDKLTEIIRELLDKQTLSREC